MAKKRDKFIDDGRVISPMNIDGMPWYTPKKKPQSDGDSDGAVSTGDSAGVPVKMTRGENIAFSFGVIKAVLLVTAVFVGVLLLFILFCIYVWFK